MIPFRIIWQSLKTLYEQLFQLFLMGLITLLALLLILPGPIALGGLWGVAHRAVIGYGDDWGEYWEALKRYGPRNWLNSLVVAVVYGLLVLNLWFYNTPGITPVSANIALVATVFWIGVSLFWTGVVFYWLSFQVEMLEPRFWLSLRNSLLLTPARPLQTLVFLGAIALATLLCVILPPLVLLLPGFVAVLSITALRELVQPLLKAREQANKETPNSTA